MLSLYSVPLEDQGCQTTLSLCVRSVCDILTQQEVEEMEQKQCMLGTGVIVFVISVSEVDVDEVGMGNLFM